METNKVGNSIFKPAAQDFRFVKELNCRILPSNSEFDNLFIQFIFLRYFPQRK